MTQPPYVDDPEWRKEVDGPLPPQSPTGRLGKRPSIQEVPRRITRRSYLQAQAILHGASVFVAIEAVASTAIEHPEWDMDEKRTWTEWEKGTA